MNSHQMHALRRRCTLILRFETSTENFYGKAEERPFFGALKAFSEENSLLIYREL